MIPWNSCQFHIESMDSMKKTIDSITILLTLWKLYRFNNKCMNSIKQTYGFHNNRVDSIQIYMTPYKLFGFCKKTCRINENHINLMNIKWIPLKTYWPNDNLVNANKIMWIPYKMCWFLKHVVDSITNLIDSVKKNLIL